MSAPPARRAPACHGVLCLPPGHPADTALIEAAATLDRVFVLGEMTPQVGSANTAKVEFIAVADGQAGMAAALETLRGAHREADWLWLAAEAAWTGDDIAALQAGLPDHTGTVVPWSNGRGWAGYSAALPVAAEAINAALTKAGSMLLPLAPPPSSGPGAGAWLSGRMLAAVGGFDPTLRSAAAAVADAARRGAALGWDILAAPRYVAVTGPAAEPVPGLPLAATRNVDTALLADWAQPKLLFVTHDWGGGVEKHLRDLQALVASDCQVLVLRPQGDATHIELSWPQAGSHWRVYFPAEAAAELTGWLRGLHLQRVHFHHVHRLPATILDLARGLGVPYDVTLHDQYPVCPQYHLTTSAGRYCGEPDNAGCNACLAERPHAWGLDIETWRQRFADWLAGAARIISPSHDTADRLQRYFPSVHPVVWAHPEPRQTLVPPPKRKVAILGKLAPNKGLDVVVACARLAQERGLPLHFRVLGSSDSPLPVWPELPLTQSGEYAEADLPALLALEAADVIWFPAQGPESYSYTMSAALAADTPIVASDLGALPERLRGCSTATVVGWDATPAQWTRALLDAAGLAEVALDAPSGHTAALHRAEEHA